MRLNINLASEPFADSRRFYFLWGSIIIALALFTALVVWRAVTATAASRGISRQVDQVQRQIGELEREKGVAQAILNRLENRNTRDRSRFINALIARKTFSWTQVFADLEKIMPPRVHVVAIRPEVNASSQLEVHMSAVGMSRESALELLRRLEQAPTFRDSRLNIEKDESQGGQASGIQMEIVAQYVPQVARGEP